jgi:hypothetical protein
MGKEKLWRVKIKNKINIFLSSILSSQPSALFIQHFHLSTPMAAELTPKSTNFSGVLSSG